MANEASGDSTTMRPACLFEEQKDRRSRSSNSARNFLHPSSSKRSLVIASLDIGRVLADRDGVTFRSQGTCMYPTIRPGDVLRIQSRVVADVLVGDIVVCRRINHLFSHRVIDSGFADGRAYVVTRPDGVRDSSDPPTFDEGLLGVVVAIERKGKRVPLLPPSYSWPVRAFFALRLALVKSRPVALLWWTDLLASLQATGLYRRMAKACLALASPRISYTVRLPMPALGEAVYRKMSLESFDVRRDWRGRPVECWTLSLHLNNACQPAAWARFTRGTAEDWRVDELFVRSRYRGTGLEEVLLRQAGTILRCASFSEETCGELRAYISPP
jgi:GNAT superfamily N-acetyltransferase